MCGRTSYYPYSLSTDRENPYSLNPTLQPLTVIFYWSLLQVNTYYVVVESGFWVRRTLQGVGVGHPRGLGGLAQRGVLLHP
jgi:hypothetical protein